MLFNAILILFILGGCFFLAWRYVKNLDDQQDFAGFEDEGASEADLSILIKNWNKEFSQIQKRSMDEDNLSKAELERRKKQITFMRECGNLATYGDEKSIRVIKNAIKDFVMDARFGITEQSINNVIPFDSEEKLRHSDLTLIVLYLYMKKYQEEAFSTIIREFSLDEPKIIDGKKEYVITNEDMEEIYHKVLKGKTSLGKVELDFSDKMEMVAQYIFQETLGFGSIDMLIHQTIDEIDVGVSGIPLDNRSLKKIKKAKYSFESTWVMYHGKNIRLECLHFKSQEELVRVCDNVYKYDAPYVLSRSEGSIINTMLDGSRIVVIRPPFCESYAFFLRKFDSAPSAKPADLIRDRNNVIPIAMMKWMIIGQRVIGITGGMGTGKSTFLKSVLRFIDSTLNIRVQEKSFELNARFTYPDLNIVALQETQKRTQQMALDLIKKMNSEVTILGEIAEAVQASFAIQSARVASLFIMFTHHANTAYDLVESFAYNLLQEKICHSEESAIRMVAKTLNIDCHLSKYRSERHIERITEIMQTEEEVKMPSEKFGGGTPMEKAMLDISLYLKKKLNPELFAVQDLVRLEKAADGINEYRLINRPSESTMQKMHAIFTDEEEAEFLYDLDMMERLTKGEESEEMEAWKKTILSY